MLIAASALAQVGWCTSFAPADAFVVLVASAVVVTSAAIVVASAAVVVGTSFAPDAFVVLVASAVVVTSATVVVASAAVVVGATGSAAGFSAGTVAVERWAVERWAADLSLLRLLPNLVANCFAYWFMLMGDDGGRSRCPCLL